MREPRSWLRRGSMPLWFRATFAAMFALLLAGFLVNRSAGVAFGRRPAVDTSATPESLLGRTAIPPGKLLPLRGGYRMNGMRVQFNTFPTPDPDGQMTEIESALKKTGYLVRRGKVQGEETVFGVHPDTKVFVSVTKTTVQNAIPALRLTQQNAGELKADFVAELPGIPEPSDATVKTLVSSLEGDGADTLSFTSASSVDWLGTFYARTMAERGWQQLVPPMGASGARLATLFFAKDGEECSILMMPQPRGPGTGVWITLGPSSMS